MGQYFYRSVQLFLHSTAERCARALVGTRRPHRAPCCHTVCVSHPLVQAARHKLDLIATKQTKPNTCKTLQDPHSSSIRVSSSCFPLMESNLRSYGLRLRIIQQLVKSSLVLRDRMQLANISKTRNIHKVCTPCRLASAPEFSSSSASLSAALPSSCSMQTTTALTSLA